MRREKDLDDLVKYVYKRYPYPKPWASKVHYAKRCAEIYASELAIRLCMESPNSDPREVIEEKILFLQWDLKDAGELSPSVFQRFNWIIDTLQILYDYMS